MKFRNGFVSNSSSSSFLIAYDTSAVLSDPKKIVDYIDSHLRDTIYFKKDLYEGWDIFALDMKQKDYLLNHRKRFEKYCSGTVTYTDYGAGKNENGNYPEIQIPFVQALTNVYEFYPYPYEWEIPEVDMSDMPLIELTVEESLAAAKDDASELLKAKAAASEAWYLEKHNRQTVARQQKKKDYIQEVRDRLIKKGENPKTLKVELVEVDYNNCDPDGTSDWEFPERYFGLDEETWYEETPGPCPKCGHDRCGSINTGVEECIFCPNCYVRTAYYPLSEHADLVEAWEEGKVVEMTDREKGAFN